MSDLRDRFMTAAFWHGDRARADRILAEHPELATADVHLAAILGEAATVRKFIAEDPSSATRKSGPFDVEPIVSLCYSVYLRDRARSDAFIRSAEALFDAGASIDAGFYDNTHSPPSWENLMYGAAGVAFNPAMTRFLLERGADPNDGETPYHSVEGPDNDAFRILLDSGQMNRDSLATMLLRKADWHDYEGLELVLNAGADPNYSGPWHGTALHQALRRDNDIENIDLLLDRGADPSLTIKPGRANASMSAFSLAVRRGRRDVLESLKRRGIAIDVEGVERLIEACALGDAEFVGSIATRVPELVAELRAQGATLIAEFAGTANAAGVERLLDLGVPVDARYEGDGYFGMPADSTPLHVAAHRGWPSVVKVLIRRGADVNARDAMGNTALMHAVFAATRSYWTARRSPESARLLLEAGASTDGITLPTGYDAIDALLERRMA